MTDYTGNVAGSVVNASAQRSDDGLGRWEIKKITFTAAAVGNQGTHNIITLPAKSVIAGGFFVITTSLVSDSTNGTLVFTAQEAMHAVLTADGSECVEGDTVYFSPNDVEDAAGLNFYNTVADTLDLTIATNDATAGEIYLFVNIVDLYDE